MKSCDGGIKYQLWSVIRNAGLVDVHLSQITLYPSQLLHGFPKRDKPSMTLHT